MKLLASTNDMLTPSRRIGIRPTRPLRLALVLVLVWGLAGGAHAQVTPWAADLEDGTFNEFSQINALNGTLTNVGWASYTGVRSARATYSSSTGANGYARGIFNPGDSGSRAWRGGDSVWYGAAFWLPGNTSTTPPNGFTASMQGQVALLRWDNYDPVMPNLPVDRSGVVIYGGDKKAHLVRSRDNAQTELSPVSFNLPEGRWFWLEVHQVFRASNPYNQVLNEVYLDGNLILRSGVPNVRTDTRPITRMRYGLVAIAAGAQTNPLYLLFDRARISPSPIGPR